MNHEPTASADAVINAMGDGVYTLDTEGRFVEVNEFFSELTGYDETDLVGSSPAMLLAEDDIVAFEQAIRELYATPDPGVTTVEATCLTADGTEISVEVNLTVLEGPDGVTGSTGVVRDITDRRARERDLARYERVVEAADDAIYTLDATGQYTSVNDRFVEQTGYSRAELVGSHVSKLMQKVDIERIADAVVETLERGDSFVGEFEFPVEYADGVERFVQARLSILPAEEQFQGTVGIVRDVTEQRERERLLRRQNERLDEFANVISHDLRNPLNVAMGRLSLVADDYESEHLDKATSALERMETLIDDMLTLARQGQVVDDLTTVDLERVILDTWASTATPDATLEVEAGLPLVRADPDRLAQLVQNLLLNCVDHAGPTVSVRVRTIDDGFAVADDGPGIPEADRELVFAWGETRAEDGTGYGLAIVESIAQAHGWTVRANESTSGGTRIEVTGVERVEGTP